MEKLIDVQNDGYKILSGSVLKTIALITMLIDHTAATLLVKMSSAVTPLAVIFGEKITLYFILRMIGRTAFPLYSFLITEGYRHTRNRKKYALRLLCFAFVSELPWDLLHDGKMFSMLSQNVFFTLFMGLAAVYIYDKFIDDKKKMIFGLAAVFALSVVINSDYGIKGVGFILFMYALSENSLIQMLCGCCFFAVPQSVIPAFGLIQMYSGKRGYINGRFLQYMFYIIYPAHMLILYILKVLWFG